MRFNREVVKERAARLAAEGVYVGTSSWKYSGWCGMLYTGGRYEWRGKFAAKRFDKSCLAEYAEVFKTVCVDAAYYAFPQRPQLEELAAQVPDDFLFAFKVTDEITIKNYPNLPRFGERAGRPNPSFLNADLFVSDYLGPCEAIRPKIGLLIFEFSRFQTDDYAHGREFLGELEGFLSRLPQGWPCAVEIRNRQWLQPEYFECLARHRVAHLFNSWAAMPPIGEQLAMPGSRPRPDLVAARFLLKPGRRYEEAVKAFEPYNKVVEIVEDARAAGRLLIDESRRKPGQKTFIYVNNRLEGNALETLDAMTEWIEVG